MPAADQRVLRRQGGVVGAHFRGVDHVVQTPVVFVAVRHLYDDLVFFVLLPTGIGPDQDPVFPRIAGIQFVPGVEVAFAAEVGLAVGHHQAVAVFVFDHVGDGILPAVAVVPDRHERLDAGLAGEHQIIRDPDLRDEQSPVGVLLPHPDAAGVARSLFGRRRIGDRQAARLALVRVVCRGEDADLFALRELQIERTVQGAGEFSRSVPAGGDRVDLGDVAPFCRFAFFDVDVIVSDYADQIDGGLVVVGDHGIAVVDRHDAGSVDHLFRHPFVVGRVASPGFFRHPVDAVAGDEVIAAVQILPVGDDRIERDGAVPDVFRVDHALDIDAEIAPERLLGVPVGAVPLYVEVLVRGFVAVHCPEARLVRRDRSGGIHPVPSQVPEGALRRISVRAPGEIVIGVRRDRAEKRLQAFDALAVVVCETGRGVGDRAGAVPPGGERRAVEISAFRRGIARKDGTRGVFLLQIDHDGGDVGAPHPFALVRERIVHQDCTDIYHIGVFAVLPVCLVGDRDELRDRPGLAVGEPDFVQAGIEISRLPVLELIIDVGPLSVGGDAEQRGAVLRGSELDLGIRINAGVHGNDAGFALQALSRVLKRVQFVMRGAVSGRSLQDEPLRAVREGEIGELHLFQGFRDPVVFAVAVGQALGSVQAVQGDGPAVEEEIVFDLQPVQHVDEAVRLSEFRPAFPDHRRDIEIDVSRGAGAEHALDAHASEDRKPDDDLDPGVDVRAIVRGVFPLLVLVMSGGRLVHAEIDVQRCVDRDMPLESHIYRKDRGADREEEVFGDARAEAAAEQDAAAAVIVVRLLVVAGAQVEREVHREVVVEVADALDLALGFQDLVALLDFFGVFPEALLEDLQRILEVFGILGVPGLLEQRTELILRARIQLRDVVGGHQDHGAVREHAETDRDLEHLHRLVEEASAGQPVGNVSVQIFRGHGHLGLPGVGIHDRVFHGDMLQPKRFAPQPDADPIAVLQEPRVLFHPPPGDGVDPRVRVVRILGDITDRQDGLVPAVGEDVHRRREFRVSVFRDDDLQSQIGRIHIHQGDLGLFVYHILAGKVYAADIYLVFFGFLQNDGKVLALTHEFVQDGYRAVPFGLDIHKAEEFIGNVVEHRYARGVSVGRRNAFRDAFSRFVQIGDRHQRVGDAHAVRSLDEPAHGVLVDDKDPAAGIGIGSEDSDFVFPVFRQADLGSRQKVSALQIVFQPAARQEMLDPAEDERDVPVLGGFEVRNDVDRRGEPFLCLLRDHGIDHVRAFVFDPAVHIRRLRGGRQLRRIGAVFDHLLGRRGEARRLLRSVFGKGSRRAGEKQRRSEQKAEDRLGLFHICLPRIS